jgi:cell division septation protein DedD
MPNRRRWFLALSVASGATSDSRAQDRDGGIGSGLLRNLRDRLTRHGGPEALREAMLLPDAAEARQVMEGLAGRGGDPIVSARAALWVGHYHYGAGDAEAALTWFAKAHDAGGGPAERAESDFWLAQCRNLLGRAQESDAGERGEGSPAVLARVARFDGELRVGSVESALRGYLGLEREARAAGCLGPLLYRLGLAASSGAAGSALDQVAVDSWAPDCVVSPEYALVREMRPFVPAAAPAAPATGDSTAATFAEAPAADTTSAPEAGLSPESALGVSRAGETTPATGTGAGSASAGGDRPFCVQLGSFHDAERAAREAARLQRLGLPVRIEVEEADGETWHRLRLGRYGSREEAEESALTRCTGLEWRIVRVGP